MHNLTIVFHPIITVHTYLSYHMIAPHYKIALDGA